MTLSNSWRNDDFEEGMLLNDESHMFVGMDEIKARHAGRSTFGQAPPSGPPSVTGSNTLNRSITLKPSRPADYNMDTFSIDEEESEEILKTNER